MMHSTAQHRAALCVCSVVRGQRSGTQAPPYSSWAEKAPRTHTTTVPLPYTIPYYYNEQWPTTPTIITVHHEKTFRVENKKYLLSSVYTVHGNVVSYFNKSNTVGLQRIKLTLYLFNNLILSYIVHIKIINSLSSRRLQDNHLTDFNDIFFNYCT